VPVVAANGNHEFNAVNFYSQFAMPGNQENFGFDYGFAHITVANDTPENAADLTAATVDALRAGADACFGAPYSFIELHERLQALQRLAGPREAEGPHAPSASSSFETLSRELKDGKLRLAVTRREFLLLECLMRHPNAPVPRDQLIRYVWQDKEDVDPSSVNLVVSRLRRKLARHLPDVRIDTVSRYGFQVTLPDA